MPYAVLNLANNQYDGWRMTQEGWELNEGEILVESLEGLSERQSPISIQQKRLLLIEQFQTLNIATRLQYQQVAVTVDTALQLGDVELALANLELAKNTEGADQVLVQGMIDLINGGGANANT